MWTPAIPHNETERLVALRSYGLMDSPPEQEFDSLARMTSLICGTPYALITLVGEKRIWAKAKYGTDLVELPREVGLCSHAILQEEPFVVFDLLQHERFKAHPMVVGPIKLRFYAGVPLLNREGLAIGTLCVMDTQPRLLNLQQLQMMQLLATQVCTLFENKRKLAQIEEEMQRLTRTSQELSEISYVLSHDIKSPINSIGRVLQVLMQEHSHEISPKGKDLIDMVIESTSLLGNQIKGVIEYFKATQTLSIATAPVYLPTLLKEVIASLNPPAWVKVNYPSDLPAIKSSHTALYHTLLNLIGNAIKYNDKDQCIISVGFEEDETHYHFSISDNGPGIPAEYQERIFKLFQTLGRPDRMGQHGSGLGLAIVKRMIGKLGGTISVQSAEGEGSAFRFSLPILQAPQNFTHH